MITERVAGQWLTDMEQLVRDITDKAQVGIDPSCAKILSNLFVVLTMDFCGFCKVYHGTDVAPIDWVNDWAGFTLQKEAVTRLMNHLSTASGAVKNEGYEPYNA